MVWGCRLGGMVWVGCLWEIWWNWFKFHPFLPAHIIFYIPKCPLQNPNGNLLQRQRLSEASLQTTSTPRGSATTTTAANLWLVGLGIPMPWALWEAPTTLSRSCSSCRGRKVEKSESVWMSEMLWNDMLIFLLIMIHDCFSCRLQRLFRSQRLCREFLFSTQRILVTGTFAVKSGVMRWVQLNGELKEGDRKSSNSILEFPSAGSILFHTPPNKCPLQMHSNKCFL